MLNTFESANTNVLQVTESRGDIIAESEIDFRDFSTEIEDAYSKLTLKCEEYNINIADPQHEPITIVEIENNIIMVPVRNPMMYARAYRYAVFRLSNPQKTKDECIRDFEHDGVFTQEMKLHIKHEFQHFGMALRHVNPPEIPIFRVGLGIIYDRNDYRCFCKVVGGDMMTNHIASLTKAQKIDILRAPDNPSEWDKFLADVYEFDIVHQNDEPEDDGFAHENDNPPITAERNESDLITNYSPLSRRILERLRRLWTRARV